MGKLGSESMMQSQKTKPDETNLWVIYKYVIVVVPMQVVGFVFT